MFRLLCFVCSCCVFPTRQVTHSSIPETPSLGLLSCLGPRGRTPRCRGKMRTRGAPFPAQWRGHQQTLRQLCPGPQSRLHTLDLRVTAQFSHRDRSSKTSGRLEEERDRTEACAGVDGPAREERAPFSSGRTPPLKRKPSPAASSGLRLAAFLVEQDFPVLSLPLPGGRHRAHGFRGIRALPAPAGPVSDGRSFSRQDRPSFL